MWNIISLVALLLPIWISAETFLIFGGKTGWIGQKMAQIIEDRGFQAIAAESRLESREEILREIEWVQPDFIINAAGMTGRPNVDWCEDHRIETIRSNLLGALNLADIAHLKGIHLTQFGTGCIYEYDAEHPIGVGFKEEEKPNYVGSFYSLTKSMLDELIQNYPNVLNLRPRMPISSDFSPRNLIVKLSKYKKVVNIPNSMTVLDDLLPVALDMILKKRVGTYNFVNPGAITHNQILTLYKRYIDPDFTWENFTLEEQARILKAGRSNNELDVSMLLLEYPDIPPIEEAIEAVFQKLSEQDIPNS